MSVGNALMFIGVAFLDPAEPLGVGWRISCLRRGPRSRRWEVAPSETRTSFVVEVDEWLTNPMSVQAAEAIAVALAKGGASVAFGVPGGGPNLDVVSALQAHGIEFVLAHTETAACIMASTWGLLAGSVTAAVVTRGPGAASAVNGAAQATLDRQPLLLVTDTVPANVRERVPHQRIDQQQMLSPVCKGSVVLGSAAHTEDVEAALSLAINWPAGCVHIDYDTSHAGAALSTTPTVPTNHSASVSAVAELLAGADRPVFIVGLGATSEGISRLLMEFGAPVLTTYQAVGTIPTSHATYGGLFTNGASERSLLEACDLVVTVGLDMVEPIPAPWRYAAPVVAISHSPTEDPYLPIRAELVGALEPLLAAVLDTGHTWSPTAGNDHHRDVQDQLSELQGDEGFDPVTLTKRSAELVPPNATVCVDAGAHFLAIMPLWPVAAPHRLLISNGLATMGYALPAAIGAALARPDTPTVALTGDGGLGMCLSELETVARCRLPVTVIVYNDATLSLIKIKQQGEGHHGGPAAVSYVPTDFAAVARAMGVPARVAHSVNDLERYLSDHDFTSPLLIDARIDPSTYPHLIEVTRG